MHRAACRLRTLYHAWLPSALPAKSLSSAAMALSSSNAGNPVPLSSCWYNVTSTELLLVQRDIDQVQGGGTGAGLASDQQRTMVVSEMKRTPDPGAQR